MPANCASANSVKLAYVDQSRERSSDDKTVWQEISGGAGHDQAGQRAR